MATRRRRNGLALRRNGQKDSMVMRETGLSRTAVKALKKKNYKRYVAAYNKAGGAATLSELVGSGKARRAGWKAKVFGGGRTTTSRSRRKTPQRDSKGRFIKKASNPRRRRRNGTKKGQYRKTARRAYMGLPKRDSKGRFVRTRRNGTKKGMRRKTARRAYMKKRKNTAFGALALRTNPRTGIAPVDALASAVDKIPVIGKPVAPYVGPLAVGAASGAGVFYLTSLIDDQLPEWAQPYSYSLAGVLGAVATLMVPVGSTSARRMVAAGMATVGAGIDVFRYFFLREETAAMSTAGLLEGEGLGAWEYTGQGALNNPGYGAYEYTGGALNNPGYGAYAAAYGNDEEGADEYNDANGADVEASGNDFDAEEGQALVRGPRQWWRRFGRPGKRMYHRGAQGTYSRHAGRKGHRWGWLIKLVGFKGARHIAAMQPHRRAQVIQQLKQQARATVQAALTHANQNIVSSQPGVYEASGPSGAHGYGALVYSGSSY